MTGCPGASRIRRGALHAALVLAILASPFAYSWFQQLAAQQPSPAIVVETAQGSFVFETYSKESPVSVAHIVDLVKAGFYDGQRVHRAVSGFVVQFGDPQTRDLEKQYTWGRGADASSGKPVGVAEISTKHKNIAFAVGLAHMGEPAKADSQLYVLLDTRPELD